MTPSATKGAAVTLLGYAAGASQARVDKTFGRDAAFVVAGIALLAVTVWQVRKQLHERRAKARNKR